MSRPFVTLPGYLDRCICGLQIGSRWLSLVLARVMFAACPFSVGLLVKFARFLGSLHWSCGAGDLGIRGVSYLELLILYERWAGERLGGRGCGAFWEACGASNFSVCCSASSRH